MKKVTYDLVMRKKGAVAGLNELVMSQLCGGSNPSPCAKKE